MRPHEERRSHGRNRKPNGTRHNQRESTTLPTKTTNFKENTTRVTPKFHRINLPRQWYKNTTPLQPLKNIITYFNKNYNSYTLHMPQQWSEVKELTKTTNTNQYSTLQRWSKSIRWLKKLTTSPKIGTSPKHLRHNKRQSPHRQQKPATQAQNGAPPKPACRGTWEANCHRKESTPTKNIAFPKSTRYYTQKDPIARGRE